MNAVNQSLDIDDIERGIRQSIAAVNEQIQKTLSYGFVVSFMFLVVPRPSFLLFRAFAG